MDDITFSRLAAWRFEDISSRVTLEDPEAATRVVIALSPCRSGSTALARGFASAGVPSALQPMKALLRWSMLGEQRGWVLKNLGFDTVFIKETLGPYCTHECDFDPLGILMRIVPASSLHLLVLGRHPHSCWRSHKQLEGKFADVRTFARSYLAVEEAAKDAKSSGIPVTTLVYEALRDAAPGIVLDSLGRSLSLALGDRLEGAANIDWPSDPSAFSPPGSYDAAMSSDRLSYRIEPSGPCPVTSAESTEIGRFGLDSLYEEWLDRSNIDLGLSTAMTRPHEGSDSSDSVTGGDSG